MAIIASFSNFRAAFSVTGTLDITGYEEWPLAKVRSGGFTTFGIPHPISVLPFTMTCNRLTPLAVIGADDAVLGVDEYDWYVSQSTDDPTKQRLIVTKYSAAKSGTIRITQQTSVVAGIMPVTLPLIPGLVPLNAELGASLFFKNVTVYCQRKSDKAIQVINIYKEAFSKAGP